MKISDEITYIYTLYINIINIMSLTLNLFKFTDMHICIRIKKNVFRENINTNIKRVINII